MRLKQTIVPLLEPITLAQAKLHLKVDGTDDDDLITALITAARQMAERETKRAFITQTWEMGLDSLPDKFEIPKPPLIRVTSIKVRNWSGDESTVTSTTYNIDATKNSPGRVALAYGCAWPTHRDFASATVTFDAGYGDKAENVPEPIKQAILQIIGHVYDSRGSQELPAGAKAILQQYKVYYL